MQRTALRQAAPRRVNVLDADLPTVRLVALRDDYRRRLDRHAPTDPPTWYAERVIAEAEALLTGREGRVAE